MLDTFFSCSRQISFSREIVSFRKITSKDFNTSYITRSRITWCKVGEWEHVFLLSYQTI